MSLTPPISPIKKSPSGDIKGKREEIIEIIDFCYKNYADNKSDIPMDKIYEIAQDKHYEPNFVKRMIDQLLNEEVIMQPKPGHIQIIEKIDLSPRGREKTCGDCKHFRTNECEQEKPEFISITAIYAETCQVFEWK